MNAEEIKQLLATDDIGSIISTLQNGRQYDLPDFENIKQDIDVRQHKVMKQAERPDKQVVVTNDDQQSGKELKFNKNGKQYRIEKVNRIALAIQQLIVKRAVAFSLGNPVNYICDPQNDQESTLLDDIKRVLQDIKSNSLDRDMATRLFSETECAEVWYLIPREHNHYSFPSTFQLRCQLISPSDGSTLFPFFDDYGDLIAFSRMYAKKDIKKVEHKFFETYTDDAHYLWEFKDGEYRDAEGYPQSNPLGKIPVVYVRQSETEWEVVQDLIDRLEKLLSNFADTNDYHASPKIFVKGNIRGWAKKGETGQIITGDENASAQYLSWSQAPEAVKLEIDTLLRMIYTITQTPDISFDTMRAVGQVSGTALKLLFMDAHLKVMEKAKIFDAYFSRRVSVIKSLLALLNSGYSQAKETIVVEPEITPYMVNDEQTKLNMLLSATGNKPLMSQRTAIEQLGSVKDVDKELEDINGDGINNQIAELLQPTM